MNERSAELTQLVHFAAGAIVMGYFVAGVFFLRYWRDTRDRLFLVFAVAFWMLGVQRALINLIDIRAEDQAIFYLLRLAAFLLIIWAVVDKNLVRRRARPPAAGTSSKDAIPAG
jgi:amino acid transporter